MNTEQQLKRLKNIYKKINEISLDLAEHDHRLEAQYNAKRLSLEVKRLEDLIETFVSGSGTGRN